MTSSASSKNELLTERPSVLATLRLTASSNLFGDSAGELPGGSHLKNTIDVRCSSVGRCRQYRARRTSAPLSDELSIGGDKRHPMLIHRF